MRILLALLLVACGDDAANHFAEVVVPVLERRCATSSCHGVVPDEAWPVGEGFYVRLDERGQIENVEETRASTLERVSVQSPWASSLLRIPSPAWLGGGPHAGGVLFDGRDDVGATSFVDWIALETSGGEDGELDVLEQQFADNVAPVLIERCARDGCHGPRDVAFAAFPLHVVDGATTPTDLRATHTVARKFLNLWGSDVRDSRLIRKALGEHAGGIIHRGDRATFFPDAPVDDPFASAALAAIVAWAEAERDALGVTEAMPRAVVYVDGPPAERAPYRIEAGALGSDLFIAGWPEPGVPRNLTSALHPDGSVEIRDAAISHDGSHVAFAMRAESETHHAIWELVLDSGEARQVNTETEGSLVQPTYASDGRIVAVWDGHGELAADGAGVASELVAINADGSLERLTYTPGPEMAPAMLASGKTRGELVFATRRRGEGIGEGVLFRFPLCHDERFHGEPEYHVQFGASIAPAAPLYARDLPDGRQLLTILPSSDESDDRGMLAVFDRSLGPDLQNLEETSLAGYRRPIAWLDRSVRYRDPAVLPDGRFLISAADDSGEDAIWLGRITDGEGGSSLMPLEPWLELPGRSLRSPVPVFARPPEDDGHAETTDSAAPEGFLVLRDVAVLESLFGRTQPTGRRDVRSDITGLRVFASLGAQASGVVRHPDGGTSAGLSDRIPVQVLAELSLPADRSAWLRVPARTPLLLSYTNERGMEVGRGLDRWFFVQGEETLPGGTNVPTFARACAGCHGAMSGDPDEAAGPAPDVISSASTTLSTHRNRNPRDPLEPQLLREGQLVDWQRTVAPLLDACVDCHGPDDSLSLVPGPGSRFDASYESLTRFVDLRTLRALRSPLMERLVGEELEAPGSPEGVCPPEGPDPVFVEAFTQWIEAGAFYDLGVVD